MLLSDARLLIFMRSPGMVLSTSGPWEFLVPLLGAGLISALHFYLIVRLIGKSNVTTLWAKAEGVALKPSAMWQTIAVNMLVAAAGAIMFSVALLGLLRILNEGQTTWRSLVGLTCYAQFGSGLFHLVLDFVIVAVYRLRGMVVFRSEMLISDASRLVGDRHDAFGALASGISAKGLVFIWIVGYGLSRIIPGMSISKGIMIGSTQQAMSLLWSVVVTLRKRK